MANVAVIDVGSNGIRMTIAALDGRRAPRTLFYYREAIRLGQDVFTAGRISARTTRRAIEAFANFRALIADHHVTRVRALGTSALREARNGADFIARVAAASGITVTAIGGDEEALLVSRAVAAKARIGKKKAIIIDIGGGSAEVTLLEQGQVSSTQSFRMGSVRLLQLFAGRNGKPNHFIRLVRDYLEPTRRYIRRELGHKKIDLCFGTGGNVEALAALRVSLLGKSGGGFLFARDLQRLITELAKRSYEARVADLKLRPDRADVILPAAVVLEFLLEQCGLQKMLIPLVSLRDGVLIEMAEELGGLESPRLREQILQSVRVIGRKFGFDEKHAAAVATFADQLFSATRKLHRLDEDDRLILMVAAWLHDIGQFVGIGDHHKHSLYLINAVPIVGLSPLQKRIAANIARYHHKSFPKPRHEEFVALAPGDRAKVRKLAALLRLADAVDFEHAARRFRLTPSLAAGTLTLELAGKKDFTLTSWSVLKHAALFEEVFDRKVAIGVRPAAKEAMPAAGAKGGRKR